MFDLKAFRTDLDVTQQTMADFMGMPLRSYQDIEAGKNPVRPIHEAAAKYAALQLAADRLGYNALPADLQTLVQNLSEARLA